MKKLAFAFIVMLSFVSPAMAVLKIDITQGNVDPIPLAVNSFYGASGEDVALGKEIREVIASDLESSGLFRSIDQSAYIEKLTVDKSPNFATWKQINAMAVVSGKVIQKAGRVHVEFRLWDPYTETQIEGLSLEIPERSWRRIAHKISDSIYKKLTGEDGYFDTRILFVSESGPMTKRIKKLAIMDQDGANLKELTDGSYMVMTPRFDPKSQRAIYMSYKSRVPKVYMLDINSGRQTLLGSFPGMSFAPRFSPDGSKAIMSIANNGATDLFEMDISSQNLHRLTNTPGIINTSPSYAPDGSRIAFNSDRGGSPQIYVMGRDGGGAKRVSFGDGSYMTPVWSPRGDFIAFTKKKGGTFYIGVMRPDGSGERLLTTSWLDEGPTWSPNGRVIMFSRQQRGGGYSIYAIDVTGFNERLVETDGHASDPAWSPLLG